MRFINLSLYMLYAMALSNFTNLFLDDWEWWVFIVLFVLVDLSGRVIGLEDKCTDYLEEIADHLYAIVKYRRKKEAQNETN